MKITKESQTQHWSKKSKATIASYLSSPPAILRSKFFVEKLKDYKFDSICEAGMFAGRNCKYISEAFPDAKVSGFDINPEAVKFAQDRFSNINIWNMDIYDANRCDKTFDIMFTSGTMIHLLPETIYDVVVGIISMANKYVMHIEQNGNNELIAGPKHLSPRYKVSDQYQFAPNLVSIYEGLGYEVDVVSLPEDCRTNGASELIIVEV